MVPPPFLLNLKGNFGSTYSYACYADISISMEPLKSS